MDPDRKGGPHGLRFPLRPRRHHRRPDRGDARRRLVPHLRRRDRAAVPHALAARRRHVPGRDGSGDGSHRDQPGRAVHGAARRGVCPDRHAHRLPDRLGPARAEPRAHPVHRADVLRGVLPGGADLARPSGARRARVVGDPRRQRAGRGRHAPLLLRRPPRPRARPAGAALDARGARGDRGRAAGRGRGGALVPGLRRGRGGAPAHPGPAGRRALSRPARAGPRS